MRVRWLSWLAVGAVGLAVVVLPDVGSAADKPQKGTQPRRVSTDVLDDVTGAQRGTQAEPYIHINPEDPDHLVAAWQENRYFAGSAQAHVAAVSVDGGKRWKETVLPGLTHDAGTRAGPWDLVADPWPEFGPDGAVYYSSLVGGDSAPFPTAIVVSRSADGGLTWGAPAVVTESKDPDFNDKNALTVDTVAGSKYAGTVYVAWDVNVLNSAGNAFVRQDIYSARSLDDGATFEAPRLVRTGAIGGGVIPRVGKKGRVYLLFTAEGADPANRYALFLTSSNNGGRTWKQSRRLWDIVGASVTDVRDGFSLASFAVDPKKGNLYVAWQDSRSDVPRILVARSTNGGGKWSTPTDVVDAPADVPAFTPAIAVNGEGEVGVSYYSLQNDPTRSVRADVFVRISADSAGSFDRTFRMTRKSFDLRNAAHSSRGWFLGDYMGLVGTADAFQAAWISTRLRAQPDVWTARTR